MLVRTSDGSLLSEAEFRRENPRVSFPRDLSGMDLSEWGVAQPVIAAKPDVEQMQRVELEGSATLVDREWRLGWRVIDQTVTSLLVNAERDRRIYEGFTYNGKPYGFDPDSKQRVTGAATLAGFAMGQGAGAGNLRWHGGSVDFTWIADDNSLVTMDAPTCFAFGQTAAHHESAHIFAARSLKDMDPIPRDFTNDKYWPTSR